MRSLPRRPQKSLQRSATASLRTPLCKLVRVRRTVNGIDAMNINACPDVGISSQSHFAKAIPLSVGKYVTWTSLACLSLLRNASKGEEYV